jgi:hypothetical protein
MIPHAKGGVPGQVAVEGVPALGQRDVEGDARGWTAAALAPLDAISRVVEMTMSVSHEKVMVIGPKIVDSDCNDAVGHGQSGESNRVLTLCDGEVVVRRCPGAVVVTGSEQDEGGQSRRHEKDVDSTHVLPIP